MSRDRELANLLAVNPSPEFVARVRQRVALEPAPRRHAPARALLALAAAAACVAAITLARVPHDANVAWPAPAAQTTAPLAATAGPVTLAATFVPSVMQNAPAARPHRARLSDVVPVPEMTYRAIEPQRGERPVAEMEVHAVPPIEVAGGGRPWSTL